MQIARIEEEDEFIQNEQGMVTLEDISIGILHLLEMALSTTMDIRSFLILCIMAIALPHCIERGSDIFSGFECGENDAQSAHATQHHFIRKTAVWVWSPPTISIKANTDNNHNDDDDDEADIERTLNLDIMSMTLNTETNKMFAELERHRFKITPNDLLCHDYYIPQSAQLPPLLLSFGAGFEFKANGGMMRIFKETSSDPNSRQFLQSHGFLTLIMSFAGIAAFAASNSIAVE